VRGCSYRLEDEQRQRTTRNAGIEGRLSSRSERWGITRKSITKECNKLWSIVSIDPARFLGDFEPLATRSTSRGQPLHSCQGKNRGPLSQVEQSPTLGASSVGSSLGRGNGLVSSYPKTGGKPTSHHGQGKKVALSTVKKSKRLIDLGGQRLEATPNLNNRYS